MGFNSELEFEKALINDLLQHGWKEVIKYPTEEQLIQNWADILFNTNKSIDRLNNVPLTRDEMGQILEIIKTLRTPKAINEFVNGGSVAIRRTNPLDTLHYGKEVSLKIYDRAEILAGDSFYQIVEQPVFFNSNPLDHNYRGDLLLLINGMPLFHIELKKSGVDVGQAVEQIVKYSKKGVFTGIYSLVQIFVAMNPEETVYFANPGPDGYFNKDFYFHWGDFNNEPINDWRAITSTLLFIPLAHELIGFFTVADDSDGVLKVMRSYQIEAVRRILTKVKTHDWERGGQLGGHIWHTTGSGKTLTSFKAAQLTSYLGYADKVVFLLDRIELGTQSLLNFRSFADDDKDVQDTEDTITLISKLKSDNPRDKLIVTSIQKMSKINSDDSFLMKSSDLDIIGKKRLVFIVDECHRSTFGLMLTNIKHTFKNGLFFGFTGTPVFKENEKEHTTTTDLFGDELHRYSIADGIRDKNVLGFDPCMVMVYKDKDLRKQVALQQAKCKDEFEVFEDSKKTEIFQCFMDNDTVPMASYVDDHGNNIKGIEDYVPKEQYQTEAYRIAVIDDINENWVQKSMNFKFSAILATSSIPEALEFYRLFKLRAPRIKVTGLFDPSIDNIDAEKALLKNEGLLQILEDYNNMYHQSFSLKNYGVFKKDVAARLAHKDLYKRISEDEQLDLLIVVNQMLTGYDSKWINSLYLDKVLKYEDLIQAFSRTNRLFNINEKPFGMIRYYRYPHTMKQNIEKAFALFSGDRPLGLFVNHLNDNIRHMNEVYEEISDLFKSSNIENFDKLPEDNVSKAKFARLYRKLMSYQQAATLQGFTWDNESRCIKSTDGLSEDESTEVPLSESMTDNSMLILETEDTQSKDVESLFTYEDFQKLNQRYVDLGRKTREDKEGVPFTIDPYLFEMNTGKIDYDYMNSRFEKWLKDLSQPNVSEEELEKTLQQLHKSFAFLSQEDQGFARCFISDVQSGNVTLEPGLKFQDYIYRYKNNAKDKQVHKLHHYLGVDEQLVYDMLNTHITQDNINLYGRFDALKDTVVREQAVQYFSKLEKKESMPGFRVRAKTDALLKEFVLNGGIDIEEIDE